MKNDFKVRPNYENTFLRLKKLNELNDMLTQLFDLHTQIIMQHDIDEFVSDENNERFINIDTVCYQAFDNIQKESKSILLTIAKNKYK